MLLKMIRPFPKVGCEIAMGIPLNMKNLGLKLYDLNEGRTGEKEIFK